MLRRVLLASLAAGFVAGLALTAIQAVGVTPLILAAETYETGGEPGLAPHSHGELTHTHAFGAQPHGHEGHAIVLANGDRIVLERAGATHAHDAGAAGHHHGAGAVGHHHDAEAWAPADGVERVAWTAVANVATAIGFALLLAALFAWRGGDVTWGKGLVWGVAGFVVFFANPAIGLHPEVPGTFAAALLDRQLWWLLTVACSAAGVGLLLIAPKPAAKIAGAALLVVPHLVGAPHPDVAGGLAPSALAEEFVIATAIANGAFWLVLGPATAIAFRRLVRH